LAYEIAVMLADFVVREARRLVELPSDKAARKALSTERNRIKHSTDRLDMLIAERMRIDAAQQQKP
jgi:hypothetical protein